MSVSPLITATPAVPPLILRATATNALMATAPCRITYLRINATTAGTVILYDNTAASGTSVFGTINAPLGTTVVAIESGGKLLKNGLFATFTTFAGTVEVGVVRN
jgi:hypothetical protein